MTSQAVGSMRAYPMDLGEPKLVCRQAAGSKAKGSLRLLVWLAVMVGFGYVCYWLFGDLIDEWPPSDNRIYLMILSLAWIPIFLTIPLIRKLRHYGAEWADMALLCPEGLAYYHHGSWREVRWKEIASVEMSSEKWRVTGSGDWLGPLLDLTVMFLLGHMRHYAIITSTGDKITFGETLDGIDKLMDEVRSRTFALRSERVMNALELGTEVQFGPITVSKLAGIRSKRRSYAWQKIETIEMSGQDGKFLTVKVRPDNLVKDIEGFLGFEGIRVHEKKVPNADVLVSLSRIIKDFAGSSEAPGVER